jgi:hypothetical protein
MIAPTFSIISANESIHNRAKRERTVPIPETILSIPGYPKKLIVYKIEASKFWQTRVWISGKTHRRSTRTQNLQIAQSIARRFYEQKLAQVFDAKTAPTSKNIKINHKNYTISELASQLLEREDARVKRGEFALGSYQVLQNRLNAHLLPRWGNFAPENIDHTQLLAFVQDLSNKYSSITVSQYLIVVRKLLSIALSHSAIDVLPEFPKIQVQTHSRGAFTPSEYWRIIRCARRLQHTRHPEQENILRKTWRLRSAECTMPPDVAWVIGFMVNSFVRPSDLKTLQHRHVEIVQNKNMYLRLTLPETKRHNKPIVTLQPAVRIYKKLTSYYTEKNLAAPNDYIFLPHLRDRNYALSVLAFYMNWILSKTGLKLGPHGQKRSLYSLRHSSITFRLLYGHGIDVLTLARNARTSVEMINQHYASTVTAEQNISLLQSRRSRQK